MGRYMRKNKVTMEVSQSSLGVRTRARTLAMARQQEQQQKQQEKQKQSKQVNVLNFCYLELRSRKLEKFFEANSSKRHKPSRPPKQQVRRAPDSIGVVTISRSSSFSSSKQQSGLVLPKVEEQQLEAAIPSSEEVAAVALAESCLELRTGEIEVSCGDNAFDHDGHSSRDSFDHIRRLRESTPVQDMLPAEAPGSSSRVRVNLAAAQQNENPSSRHLEIPSPEEIEDFFAAREEPDEEKSRLSDRYNYDFVNDVPLPGRFEWTPASL